jgi:hypothetical protein
MKKLIPIMGVMAVLSGCGPQHTHSDPNKPKKQPDDVLTARQFQSIKVGESVTALAALYPHIEKDDDGSGDVTFKSVDGHGVYVLRYGCRDGGPALDGGGNPLCAEGETIVAAKNYYTKDGS